MKTQLTKVGNMNPFKMPRRLAKVASVEQFKLAYGDPHGYPDQYGQYGHDHQDDGSGALNTALMLGGGAALAGGLHHGLMNTRGNILGGGLVNAYQKGIGGSIRGMANDARQGMGVAPVAMPPHPLVGHAQDLLQMLYDNKKKVMGGIGTAALGGVKAWDFHNNQMGADTNAGKMYRSVAEPVMAGAGKAVAAGQNAAKWVGEKAKPVIAKGRAAVDKLKGPPKAAPEPSVSPETQEKVRSAEGPHTTVRKQPKPAATPKAAVTEFKKKSSMIYQGGADAALATYFR